MSDTKDTPLNWAKIAADMEVGAARLSMTPENAAEAAYEEVRRKFFPDVPPWSEAPEAYRNAFSKFTEEWRVNTLARLTGTPTPP